MKIVDRLKSLKDRFSYKQKIGLLVCAGILVGLGGLFMYLLRAHTYIADDPSACVNCHIMTPYYATWSHSSHGRDATCNDCHVERQAIMAEDASAEVIMDNCIRCHTQLNQELVKTGRIDYMMAKRGEGVECWHCHRNVPHGGMNSLMSTPGAEGVTPLPPSPVPEWLGGALSNK